MATTRVVYPSARLSANGAAALLDTVDRGLRVCDLPSGDARWDLGEDHDVAHAVLLASGKAAAWIAENDRFTILTSAGETQRDLPASRERIRAVAVGDDGDSVAVLIAATGESSAESSTGKLVVGPAETDLPVFDTATLLANDDLTLLAVESSSAVDDRHDSRAFLRDGDALQPLWTAASASEAHGALALYGDWLVAATAAGLAAWRRTGEQATMPGTLRDRLIFSPDGSHLLAYAAEEVIDVSSARMRFRLIDLASLTEARRAVHLIDDRRGAQFALDAELELFEVRATRAGELAVKELGWSGGAAVPT